MAMMSQIDSGASRCPGSAPITNGHVTVSASQRPRLPVLRVELSSLMLYLLHPP